jgi:hypothetical protein
MSIFVILILLEIHKPFQVSKRQDIKKSSLHLSPKPFIFQDPIDKLLIIFICEDANIGQNSNKHIQ